MIRQVIVFINLNKFHGLLGEDATSAWIGYSKRSDDGRFMHLDSGTSVLYVYDNGSRAGAFDETAAASSTYLLIPDHLSLDYCPLSEFVVLYHTETPGWQIEKLRRHARSFKGARKSYEASDTVYGQIARQIRNRTIDVDAIWVQIDEGDARRLAAKEAFLSEVCFGKPLSAVKLPLELEDLQEGYDRFRQEVSDRFNPSDPSHMEAYEEFLKSLK